MPKDEFDFEDPFELNGMAILTHEDTTDDMAECFIEEFMRMGHKPAQLLAMFRNPHYLGPNMAYEKRGEPFIRELIGSVFAKWGRSLDWSSIPAPQAARTQAPPAPSPELQTSTALDPMGAPAPNLNL